MSLTKLIPNIMPLSMMKIDRHLALNMLALSRMPLTILALTIMPPTILTLHIMKLSIMTIETPGLKYADIKQND